MKAVIQNDYSGISGLSIEEVKEKEMSSLSAIIKTKFVPVLPYDLMTEYGNLKKIRNISLPMIIGYGFGGTVIEVGKLRNKNLIGKNVIGISLDGSTKEIINSQVPLLLFKVPDDVKIEDATTIIGGADAALKAVKTIEANRNDTILVTGASGGVGSYIVQLLKLEGAKVIALASESNREFIKNLGADVIINYQSDLRTQFIESIIPNKVIDTVGSIKILDEISYYFNRLEILSLSLMHYVPKRNLNQVFKFVNGPISPNGYKKLLKLLSEKKIRAYVQNKYNFEDVKNAQLESKEKHSKGRILLEFS